jgi:hypothetical protein
MDVRGDYKLSEHYLRLPLRTCVLRMIRLWRRKEESFESGQSQGNGLGILNGFEWRLKRRSPVNDRKRSAVMIL